MTTRWQLPPWHQPHLHWFAVASTAWRARSSPGSAPRCCWRASAGWRGRASAA